MNLAAQLGRIAAREQIKQAEGRGWGNLSGGWESLAKSKFGKFFSGGDIPSTKTPDANPGMSIDKDGVVWRTYANRMAKDRAAAAARADVPYANLAPPQVSGRAAPDVNPYLPPASYIDPMRSAAYGLRELDRIKLIERLGYGGGAVGVGGAAYLYAAPLLEERRQNIKYLKDVRDDDGKTDGYDKNYRKSEKQYFDADHPGMKMDLTGLRATKDVPSIPNPTITGGK